MAQIINNPNGGINSGAFTNLDIDMSAPAQVYKPVYKHSPNFNKQIEIEKQNIALEQAKLNAEKSKTPAQANKNMTLTHIGLFVGGLALGYFAYKKFKK